jgi:hypothetical protein
MLAGDDYPAGIDAETDPTIVNGCAPWPSWGSTSATVACFTRTCGATIRMIARDNQGELVVAAG